MTRDSANGDAPETSEQDFRKTVLAKFNAAMERYHNTDMSWIAKERAKLETFKKEFYKDAKAEARPRQERADEDELEAANSCVPAPGGEDKGQAGEQASRSRRRKNFQSEASDEEDVDETEKGDTVLASDLAQATPPAPTTRTRKSARHSTTTTSVTQ